MLSFTVASDGLRLALLCIAATLRRCQMIWLRMPIRFYSSESHANGRAVSILYRTGARKNPARDKKFKSQTSWTYPMGGAPLALPTPPKWCGRVTSGDREEAKRWQ